MWRSDLGCPNMEEIPASKKTRKQYDGSSPQGFRLANIFRNRIAFFPIWSQVLFSDQSTSEASMVAPSPETQWRFFQSGEKTCWWGNLKKKQWGSYDQWRLIAGWWFHSKILIKYLSFEIEYKMYKFSGVIPENLGYFCKNLTCAYIYIFWWYWGKTRNHVT